MSASLAVYVKRGGRQPNRLVTYLCLEEEEELQAFKRSPLVTKTVHERPTKIAVSLNGNV